jgi:hypothetical protein
MAGKLGTHIRSNAVGYVALFVALGGTSYAATLPRNSVGSKQLKNNAVTSAKIRKGAVRSQDLAPGVVRRGPRGPEGPGGSNPDKLPSGKTLRGRFDAADPANQTSGAAVFDSISFGAQLAAAPTRTIVLNPPGPAQCPGTVDDPQAAPGQLCLYVGDRANLSSFDTIVDGVKTGGTTRQGAGVVAISSAAGPYGARGSWAVTAP